MEIQFHREQNFEPISRSTSSFPCYFKMNGKQTQIDLINFCWRENATDFLLDVQSQRLFRTHGPLSRDVQVTGMHDRRFDVIFVMNNARTPIFLFDVVRHT